MRLDGIKTTWRYFRLTTILDDVLDCTKSEVLMAIQSWGVGSVYTWHRVRLVGWMNWWTGEGGGIISSLIVWLIESCCTNKRGLYTMHSCKSSLLRSQSECICTKSNSKQYTIRMYRSRHSYPPKKLISSYQLFGFAMVNCYSVKYQCNKTSLQ